MKPKSPCKVVKCKDKAHVSLSFEQRLAHFAGNRKLALEVGGKRTTQPG